VSSGAVDSHQSNHSSVHLNLCSITIAATVHVTTTTTTATATFIFKSTTTTFVATTTTTVTDLIAAAQAREGGMNGKLARKANMTTGADISE
jgi:hypothetical protein